MRYNVTVILRLHVAALDDPQARPFRYELDADRPHILLGRRGGVDVLLPSPRVSLVHARIERRGEDYYLSDEGSTNGTRLNGVPLVAGERQRLRDGDRLTIGDYSLQVALATGMEGRAESSLSMARGMVREVLERLGPGQSQPSFEVLDGPQTGIRLALTDFGRTYVLGRAAGDDLRLDDVDMWREHAALVRDDLGVTIRQMGPTSPLINGERLVGARQLHDGDAIRLGATTLRYHDPAEVYLRQLEASEGEGRAHTRLVRRVRTELWMVLLAGVAVLALVGFVLVLWWVFRW